MPDGQVLEFTRVTKRFNDVTAVSDFSARVEPGVVTAFLGPNGAGKTTTLRILLGQVRATSGTATIGGVAYPELRHPLRTIGAVLEDTAYRPRRSASRQLTIAAKANGIPLSRVDEVLSLVGLEHESEGRIGSFSLGMRQRLSVAHALLGDPGALVFDEPANGLDPEGIRWMRLLMRRLADEGRTVLVSSHVLSEIEQVADNVLVLSKGELVLSSGIEKLADPSSASVVVDAADRAALTSALSAAGFEVEVLRSGLTVRGGNAGTVGAIAASAGIALSTLVQRGPTLEDVFIELVRGGTLAPRAVAAASQLVDPADAAAPGAEAGAGAVDAPALPAAGVVPLPASAVPPTEADAADADAVAADAPENTDAEADAADTADDAAAYAADAADDAEYAAAELGYAAAELGYAADASDANVAEDAADVVSEAADTHVDDDAPVQASTSEAPAAAGARPSFDEILFGVSPEEPNESADSASVENREADAPVEPTENGEAAASEDVTDEHSGVEFFTDLHGTGGAAADAAGSDAVGEADTTGEADTAGEEDSAGDEDSRSAAVSSMLAAAARAYYEDEPKDYPLGDAVADSAQDDSAHWTVASTGLIDEVPVADSGEAGEADGSGAEQHEGEQHEGEQHEGEQHEGEQHRS